MAANTQLNTGTTGDMVRTVDKAGVKTQVVTLDLGGAGSEQLINGSFPVSQSVANNSYAQALAVTSGATSTLVTIGSSLSGYQVKGLIAHGTGDGYYFIQISGVTVLSGRIRSTAPMLIINLNNGVSVQAGSVISLKVTNESGSTADYEATLLGA